MGNPLKSITYLERGAVWLLHGVFIQYNGPKSFEIKGLGAGAGAGAGALYDNGSGALVYKKFGEGEGEGAENPGNRRFALELVYNQGFQKSSDFGSSKKNHHYSIIIKNKNYYS